jgi:hypothetical protein
LRKLEAFDNPRITTVDPFANTLEKLDAGGDCGIGMLALEMRQNYKVLMRA